MRRCQDRGFLSSDGPFPLDPDVAQERIDLVVPHTGSLADAYWHHLIQCDPKELLAMRVEQKTYLARYARQSVFEWEHREVRELNDYFSALGDVIKHENEMNRAQEDHR